MEILKINEDNFTSAIAELNRRPNPDPEIAVTVTSILSDIRESGDAGVLKYNRKFGAEKQTLDTLKVAKQELSKAWKELPKKQQSAMYQAHKNVELFAQSSLRKNWQTKNHEGSMVGERFDPLPRVGIYVPGGTAPLVSTVLMTCSFAAAAKVPEIVVVSPPTADGGLNTSLLAALHLAGATEVYATGGAQAIGALAYGTETIPPVSKIFGPGNAYVVEAKRQVFGEVAVDLLPGPSEILIIADTTADPAWIAADLLAQAEHGAGSSAVLVTTSGKVLDKVVREIQAQVESLSRAEHLQPVLDHGTTLVQVASITQAVEIANSYAPEHLSLAVSKPDALAAKITAAGAIFLGHVSPVAAGDFMVGPSHELPTGGAAKSFPGLTADMFQRRTSIVELSRTSLRQSLQTIETFAEMEGLDAHGHSAAIRLRKARVKR